jgi:hypothetical protein
MASLVLARMYPNYSFLKEPYPKKTTAIYS